MKLTWEAKLVSGLVLLSVPTIMFGGLTLLGLLTAGVAGLPPGGLELTEKQWSLWRAGHAHAGVWVILSLVMQILIDPVRLSKTLTWTARLGVPAAAVLVPGGFFGLAFFPVFRWLIYLGGLFFLISVVLTGVGLLRSP